MKDTEREYVLEHMASLADILHKECVELNETIDDTWDAETVSKRVGRYEEDADEIYHELLFFYHDKHLRSDAEAVDLMRVVTDIEELTDLVDDLAKDLVRYNISAIKDNATVSLINSESAASKLCDIVLSMQKGGKLSRLFKDALELDHYKVEAGKIYDRQLNRLFVNEKDPIEVIKWHNLYRAFMGVFNGYEKVSESLSEYIVHYG